MKQFVTLWMMIFFVSLWGQHYRLTEISYLHNMGKLGEPEMEKELWEGSPFVFDKWYKGDIITNDNKDLLVSKINYHARRHKFYYLVDKDYYELYPDKVKFVIIRTPKGDHIFVPALPHPVVTNYDGFYEVFTPDASQIYVIKIHHKKLQPANRSQSYASDKSLEKMKYYDKSHLYVLVNNVYVKAPKSVNKLAKLLHLNAEQTKAFKKTIRQHKWNIRKGRDLQKIMEYYYTELKEEK